VLNGFDNSMAVDYRKIRIQSNNPSLMGETLPNTFVTQGNALSNGTSRANLNRQSRSNIKIKDLVPVYQTSKVTFASPQPVKKVTTLSVDRDNAKSIVQQCSTFQDEKFKERINPIRDTELKKALETYRDERYNDHREVIDSIVDYPPANLKQLYNYNISMRYEQF